MSERRNERREKEKKNIPSRPKISATCPQFAHTNVLIFCTSPKIGTPTFSNMATPRTASRKAKSCGVETITAPARGTLCVNVNCTSPVPGGKSITSTSRAGQETSKRSCVRAFWSMRPRHASGWAAGTRKPMDMAWMP